MILSLYKTGERSLSHPAASRLPFVVVRRARSLSTRLLPAAAQFLPFSLSTINPS